MSLRTRVAMDAAEVAAFLAAERTLVCATLGRDGWPHLTALWYVLRDGECWAWTYAKSQKVRNLERDARCTLQVEAGEAYGELRGVMLKCEAALYRDVDVVAGIGLELAERYGTAMSDAERAAMRRQATKRVGLQFRVRDSASWDHRKLATGGS